MLQAAIRRYITAGRLTISTPQSTFTVGQFDPSHPVGRLDLAIRFMSEKIAMKVALHPDLFLGEAYMDGDLVIERGTLWDLMDLAGYNMSLKGINPLAQLTGKAVSAILHRNGLSASRRNVAHHYDLSGALYRLFLDQDLQYSCAYFRSPNATIDEAQIAKKQHIAAKLLLKPGLRILDIGCGWGGLAMTLAQIEDVRVHGITLSQEQLAVARERVRAAGLADRVTFELIDYRKLQGSYDRIVSVGMFEHVGTPNYGTYFNAVARLLTPNGVALIHSIGKSHGPSATSAWIRKYIFPGGYIPALSEVLPAVERSGLWTTDVEILRLHYAETLRHWRERFMARKAELRSIYDERFERMWEFYLAGSEMSFRHLGFMIFQIQLSRSVNAVPLVRDYMVDAERDMQQPAYEARAGVSAA